MNRQLKIAFIRAEKSQAEVARATGIPESRLSRIVNEWVSPNPHEQERISGALGVPREALFADVALASMAVDKG